MAFTGIRACIVCAAALCLPSFWSCSGQASVSGPLIVSPADIDVGRVFRGQQAQAHFSVHNGGLRSARIESIHSDCQCTTATAPDRTIPAGSTVEMSVTVSTAYFDGILDKTTVLRTDLAEQPQVELRVKGTVVPEFIVSPTVIVIPPGNHPIASHEIRIERSSGASARVLSASSELTSVNVALTESGDRTGIAAVSVEASGSNPIFGNVVVRTSSAYMPELRIPIRRAALP